MARGDQFLAGAAFAGDQHAGIARGHQGDALENRLHGRAGADNLLRCRDFRRPVRPAPLAAGAPLQGPGHRFQGLVQVERLGQVIERSPFDRLDRRAQVAMGRHDDDRSIC